MIAFIAISNVLYLLWWAESAWFKHFVYPGCCR